MSVGYGLIKSVLSEGSDAFVLLLDRGITRESFQGDERAVFSSIEHFFLNYGTLPTLETISVDSGITVPWDNFPIEPPNYWLDLVLERTLLLRAGGLITQAQTALGNGNIASLRECIQQAYISLEQGTNSHSFKSITEAARDVVDQHNTLQQNSSMTPGIPFAFPYLNLISGGMGGGDIISWIGRPGVCKSYLLLNEAMLAHDAGKKVLFVSMEMPITQCARRILSLRTRVNYTRLRLGRVSAFGIQRIDEEINRMASQLPFQILSGGVFGTVDRIQAQIKHYRPDVVYVDGAYLVRTSTKGGQRWERALQVIEKFKNTSLSEDIPISVSYSFNKTAPGTLEGIGYTDGLAQLSSIAISIESEGTDDHIGRPIQYRTLKLLKGREGEAGKIRIMLDFDQMQFSQESVLSGLSDNFEYEDNEIGSGLGNETDPEPVAFL